MDGALVCTGKVLAVEESANGRSGRVSVRGARVLVALDLVPEARTGDFVLVHAGVAIARVSDDAARTEMTEEA
jgi:hydrogenase expression/formation protein HypC